MALRVYADPDFYKGPYLQGRQDLIPEEELRYWIMQATAEMRKESLGNIDALKDLPEEVQMCCCEVAEKLYTYESVKSENGMIVQSYDNDGQKATYKTDDMSEAQIKKQVRGIIIKWLINTNLLYCGVQR